MYKLLNTGDGTTALEYGAAHGALSMATPGDTSMAPRREVDALMKGGDARLVR